MRTVAIIQARMGSTRLPGKVMMNILNFTMLEWVVKRVANSQSIDGVIVATTDKADDDLIEEWCLQNDIECYRGSSDDVLLRFYNAAKKASADIIVRITADDPLKDPQIIDTCVNLLIESQADYCSNTICPSYPEGLDVEALTFASLDIANKQALLKSEREHVTPYIWKNDSMFKIKNFSYSEDLSSWRWTVDREEDIKFIRNLLEKTNASIDVNFESLIKALKDNPEFLKVFNNKTIRNEGYLKSVQSE